MRDSNNDFHPEAAAEIEKLGSAESAEMRHLVRVMFRRRRAVIKTGNMDANAIAHTLTDGRIIYLFEQAGRVGGMLAFLYVKDEIFYVLSAAGYEGDWNVEASETAYFQALAAAVRRIDEI